MKRLLFLLLTVISSVALAQNVAPDVLVKKITNEVINVVKQDKEIQAGNSKRIENLVEKLILPHFDFPRMTQIAVGLYWRRATPEQRTALTKEFEALLVRTYSNSLALYRDQTIDFMPLHMRPSDTEVTVRSEIRQQGAQPVTLNYVMEKTPAGWKVIDIKVSGVSLITNYREDFAAQIRESGIDGLIKALSAKNKSARKE